MPGENLSACLYLFRILRNYEIEEGAFTFRQDLFDHVEMEKENIQPPNSTDSLSVRMICKAVKVSYGPKEEMYFLVNEGDKRPKNVAIVT